MSRAISTLALEASPGESSSSHPRLCALTPQPRVWDTQSESLSVVSDSLQPHGLYSPWNSPGQNTGVGSCSLHQGNLPNSGIKPNSPTLQADSLAAEPPGEAPYSSRTYRNRVVKINNWGFS